MREVVFVKRTKLSYFVKTQLRFALNFKNQNSKNVSEENLTGNVLSFRFASHHRQNGRCLLEVQSVLSDSVQCASDGHRLFHQAIGTPVDPNLSDRINGITLNVFY